ncbi:MAG: hypothetical protein KGO92_03990, partial [Bacteroidota bacterium]|nr:hypothetical protein [Bacteroidota bacterium]
LSPIDVSIGNFTGAGIQAVTKSGGNQWKGSLYQYVTTGKGSNNESGENPDHPERTVVNSRKGFQIQGAVRPNRLFYYLNGELERNASATKFSASQYSGYSRDPGLWNILSNTIKETYHYDPGSLWDKTATVNADRLAIRIDWNAGAKSKYTFSFRYSLGDRNYVYENDSKQLHFSNDGYHLLSKTTTYTAEWKTTRLFRGANRLLLTYTHITDERSPNGKPFPHVRINDGEGVIQFGTDVNSGINDLSQKNLTLYDKYSFWWGRHLIHLGIDGEYNQVQNAFIQNSFGNYSFSSLSNFLTQSHPSGYQLGIPLLDNWVTDRTASAARFSKMKISFFLGDQFSPVARLRLQMGIRMDYHRLLNAPAENPFVNDSLLPILQKYYPIETIRSGAAATIPVSLSPRLGLVYAIPEKGMVLEGGLGLFAGRIPLVWPGGSYLYDGLKVGGYTASPAALQQMRFRPDPYQQWKPAETGSVLNKIPLDLMEPSLSLPKRFTGTFHAEKKWLTGWKFEMDISFSKMLKELQYTQINLLPPADTVSGPDNRWVYTSSNGGLIPIRPDGSNPFGYVILIGNQKGKKGSAQTFDAALSKSNGNGWQWQCRYSWGKSRVYQDGSSSINSSQWRLVESVNGRNRLVLSESDHSPGHRIFLLLTKEIRTRLQKIACSISLTYTGSSGNGFSYVYGGLGMTRDDGLFGDYDLIYIPDPSSLETMIFLPLSDAGETYSPAEQKKAFGQYLEKTPYLQKRRGQYAERNGSRTPFMHRADLGLQKKIQIGSGKHRIYGQWMLDIYNILNLINNNWGRVYEVPFDAYPLLEFAGYTGNGALIPQYRFHPKTNHETPWKIATSYHPLYSSFWSIRLGLKISL